MNGKGFMIWQLDRMPPSQELVSLLKNVDIKWISIKIADYLTPYNQIGGSDKVLKYFVEKLQSAHIEVGGWHYIYPTKCGPQGGLASERIEKLGLDHLLIDAEGEWKQEGLKAEAELYCNSLDVNKVFPVGLCSYRFPALHAPFPFKHFLNHPKVKFIAPQMYWLGSHNPAEQLKNSKDQYRLLSDKPYWPIGCTFGWGGWEPSEKDLAEFMNTCHAWDLSAHGWYSLDWLLRNKRYDWLSVIGGTPAEPPPVVEKDTWLKIFNCYALNFRDDPVVTADRLGALIAGQRVRRLDQAGDWVKVKYEADGWMHKNYLQEI